MVARSQYLRILITPWKLSYAYYPQTTTVHPSHKKHVIIIKFRNVDFLFILGPSWL